MSLFFEFIWIQHEFTELVWLNTFLSLRFFISFPDLYVVYSVVYRVLSWQYFYVEYTRIFKNEPIWTKVILVYLFVFAETFILKFFFW